MARVLGAIPGRGKSGGDTGRPVGLVQFAKLKLSWNEGKNRVASDLAHLHKTVMDEFGDDPLSRGIGRLDEVLGHFQAGLGDCLDDLANAATPEARRNAAKASEAIATEYFDYVMTDPLIDLIETNPFMNVVISGRLFAPLAGIRRELGIIAA